VELRDYWRTIKRRWMTIVACLLLTVAVAGVVTWQTTPQYASTARLFVSTSPSDASQAYQGGLFATQRVASYADLIQSQQLAEQVSEDLGGDPTAAELPGKVEEPGAHVAVLPAAPGVFQVQPVGRGVLGDDQQLLHAGFDQPLGFTQYVGGRARHQISAQLRDNAECAAIVATL